MPMSSMNKSDTKTGVDRNLKALRDKACRTEATDVG